jgi:hypothetical protein
LLRAWLVTANMVEGRDYQVVVIVPPKQILKGLVLPGHLDGYCVGEPWNSLQAVLRGLGCRPGHQLLGGTPVIRKVLAVRGDWAGRGTRAARATVAAVLEACHCCDQPEAADTVVELLTGPEYLHLPAEFIRPAWSGHVPDCSLNLDLPEFNCFHRFDANYPTPEKALWILRELYGDHPARPSRPDWIASVFRMDVYEAARARLSFPSPNRTPLDTPMNPTPVGLLCRRRFLRTTVAGSLLAGLPGRLDADRRVRR